MYIEDSRAVLSPCQQGGQEDPGATQWRLHRWQHPLGGVFKVRGSTAYKAGTGLLSSICSPCPETALAIRHNEFSRIPEGNNGK